MEWTLGVFNTSIGSVTGWILYWALAWRRLEAQFDSLADILQRFLTGFALRPAAFQGRAMRDVMSIFSRLKYHLDVHAESLRKP